MCLWHVWKLQTNSQRSFVLLWKHNMHFNPSSYSETRNEHTGHVGTAHSEGLRFITVALLWRVGDWAGTANMTVLSPWPGVEVMSLSEMNHSNSPEGPPGLFLKSYIIVLLRGRPAFNIVMIPFSKVMYLVWIHPCIHKLFLYHVERNNFK